MIRRALLFLLIGGVIAASFLVGRHFYRRNLSEMRAISETCFRNVLTAELEKKQKQLNVPLSSSGVQIVDTTSFFVRITSAEGTKIFRVDEKKNTRNISKNSLVRGMHSLIWEENPLSPDSLNMLWLQSLVAHKVNATTSIRMSVINLDEKASYFFSNGVNYADFPSSTMFVAYAGNRCEVEVCGFLHHTFIGVILHKWSSFLGLGVIVSIFFFYVVHWSASRFSVNFKDNPDIYELCPGLLFDARLQIMLKGRKKKSIAPQSCLILKLFLDAPEHILSYSEIIEGVWKEDKSATIRRFTVASSRLCNMLEKYDCPIDFKRVGTDRYRLIFLNDKKAN